MVWALSLFEKPILVVNNPTQRAALDENLETAN